MPHPVISVVIPTRGRETRLTFALEALAQQTLPADQFEVVVVRDGPAPGPRATPPEGLGVRFLELPERGGPAAARNAGWQTSSALFIAFTDSDCRPSPGWLEALLAPAGDSDVLVQGRTEPDPDERHLYYGLARTVEVTAPTNWYETCNILYPRDLLERAGGFDPAFQRAVEDADLGLRALACGGRRVWARDALVWHAVHVRMLPDALREAQRWEYNALLLARHPGHRNAFYRRYFWASSHARLLVVLLCLPLARRSPGLVLPAILVYLDGIVDRDVSRRRLIGQLLNSPLQALLDASEIFALVRGSIKYGALVL